MDNKNENQVTIVDVKMPFLSMVVFMVKAVIASIPAIFILTIFAVFAGEVYKAYSFDNWTARLSKNGTKSARIQIEDLAFSLDMYHLDVGRYPSSDQGLNALIERPSNVKNWNGPYLREKKVPNDPWNYEYNYRSPGEHGKFDIYTLGADNTSGGEGEDRDVVSWD